MRLWHKTIHDDLAPLTVIPRGFGGSNMNDALNFADRIVIAYQPRAIVLYEGDNDVAQKIAPAKIAETFDKFIAKVHGQFPECRIYVLAIKPSLRRWSMWPDMQKANALIAGRCADDERLTWVDIATPMLNNEGYPRQELFVEDNLHMTREGYIIWRDTLRPILLKTELEHEPQNDRTPAEHETDENQ